MMLYIDQELLVNLGVTVLGFVYVFLMIILSTKAEAAFNLSKKSSRKILHLMTGNLVFILPLFTNRVFPLIVAAPFIPITFLASPHSPFKGVREKLSMLQDKTEIGHSLGLFFYSISFTVLTGIFFPMPYVVAAGVLPMAYGDSLGARIGERYGKWKYKILASKSFEGSLAVFTFSFVSVLVSLIFYSLFFPFTLIQMVLSSLLVALIAVVVEALSPHGVDNIFVPFLCAAFMYIITVGA
jgi:dolichol kinase